MVDFDKIFDEIREDAEAGFRDGDGDLIPESVFDSVRRVFSFMQRSLEFPDMMWDPSGGVGMEWRFGDDIIATVSVLEDSTVIFGVSELYRPHVVEGMCGDLDGAYLAGFFLMLEMFQEGQSDGKVV